MNAKPYTQRETQLVVGRLKATLMAADGEGEALDVVGDIKSIETQLADIRKGAAVEFESGMSGERWRIYVPSPNDRSYNTPRLVKKFADAMGTTAWAAFVWLYNKDVVRLSWQFQKLLSAANEADVTITTAHHEIVDGDDADIGVFKKKGYPSYERVE